MADLQSQLASTLSGAYTIERELGGGGMSREFVADELRLGRKVVVKVLSPDLAAGISAERFEREIKLAASLQQANIVPVLSVGETNGLPWFTMPFVEGESLRQRLGAGPIPLDDTVPVAMSMSDQMFDSIRGSARFAAMLERYGYDRTFLTSPRGGRPQ
jgi:serine/threonine-protein kinase